MEHPFIDKAELQEKTLEQLQDTIAGLMNKLTFAYRTGNGPLIHQLQMVLATYKTQQSKKMDEVFEKQKIQNKINIVSDKK
jgi:hypothetical protein